MKPSAKIILRYLRRGWKRNRDIFTDCPTNTPTKRVSELYHAGLIVKRRCPDDPRFIEYKARRAA